jgi:hypothetical protein
MKNFVAIICIVLLAGCYNDKADKLYPVINTGIVCDTTNVTFSKDVLPIMMQQCATSTCHDAASAESGYILSEYNGVLAAATNGNKLLLTIKHDPSEASWMPKNLPMLDSCSINKITRWVNQGAQNN